MLLRNICDSLVGLSVMTTADWMKEIAGSYSRERMNCKKFCGVTFARGDTLIAR